MSSLWTLQHVLPSLIRRNWLRFLQTIRACAALFSSTCLPLCGSCCSRCWSPLHRFSKHPVPIIPTLYFLSLYSLSTPYSTLHFRFYSTPYSTLHSLFYSPLPILLSAPYSTLHSLFYSPLRLSTGMVYANCFNLLNLKKRVDMKLLSCSVLVGGNREEKEWTASADSSLAEGFSFAESARCSTSPSSTWSSSQP